jgi:transcription-repair coupling factor (superfamily II helicase)
MSYSLSVTRFFDTVAKAGRLRVHVSGIHTTCVPFLLAALHEATGRPMLVLARDSARAELLQDQLHHLLGEADDVGLLPMPFVSPYLDVTVDSRRMTDALGLLSRIARGERFRAVVAPIGAATWRIPRPEALASRTRLLKLGDELDRETFVEELADAGYARVEVVTEPGTFAVRGGLLDVYPPGADLPFRLDFFGDMLDVISRFLPHSQLTTERVHRVELPPAGELPSRSATLAKARPVLLEMADAQGIPSSRLGELLEGLRRGELPPGSHALLPILADADSSLIDYFDSRRLLVVFDDQAELSAAHGAFLAGEARRHAQAVERGRLALPPERLFLPLAELEESVRPCTQVNCAPLDLTANTHFDLPMQRPLPGATPGGSRLPDLEQRVAQAVRTGLNVVVTDGEEKELNRMARLLVGKGVQARLEKGPLRFSSLLRGDLFQGVRCFLSGLEHGVDCPDLGLFVATPFDLFDRRVRARPQAAVQPAQNALAELDEGDFVVHRDYGIGRFEGVVRRVLSSGEYACLKIRYAGEDALYVPVHAAGVVQRYIGSGPTAPKLDKLGSASWQKRVDRARKAAKKLAFDLLDLYARRQAAEGHMFSPSDSYFEEFEASFPYEETPDQARAIEEVLADMEKPCPMDRLVCGDVGFGKTEVAIRAAFKAVLDGRQVAVLVPTTVLAEQHRITFRNRLAAYPVTVDSLSRFKSAGQQTQLLKRLEAGTVDIVVGTHRLLSRDIRFKDLGLLVVDEEHRFGVGHKERLKTLRTSVDVLSLTATPIPRTFYMAMSGIRDLSVIRTPPLGRLDIRTEITPFDPDVIARAIRFELQRGGQVFFLHNRVEDIGDVRDQIVALVPEARVLIGHGQMSEEALEESMIRFMDREADVLLCTTIIESGLDMPSVNTLIVNNAHAFGLAQLYQIRGRVGRGSVQAFAWFVVPPLETMSTDARARLATLARFTSVGSGMNVASIDMELRGAGDVLGPDQSGHVEAVGIDLYTHLLHEAVAQLKEQQPTVARFETAVEIPVQVSIPDEYVPDRHQRLVFYRIAATAEDVERLEQLRTELSDRYGPLPTQTADLLTVAELRIRGQHLGLKKIDSRSGRVTLDLSSAPDSVLARAIRLVKDQPLPIRVVPPHSLVADCSALPFEGALERALHVVGMLEGRDKA